MKEARHHGRSLRPSLSSCSIRSHMQKQQFSDISLFDLLPRKGSTICYCAPCAKQATTDAPFSLFIALLMFCLCSPARSSLRVNLNCRNKLLIRWMTFPTLIYQSLIFLLGMQILDPNYTWLCHETAICNHLHKFNISLTISQSAKCPKPFFDKSHF